MLPYSKKVIEHFKHPRNVGEIKDADAVAMEGSPACGDMLKISIKVNEKTHVITDIKFESFGCASNIATASILTEMVKGRTVEEAEKISWKQAADELGGLPPVKMHCAVLAVDALKSAIEQWKEKHGLISKEPTTPNKVLRKLRNVLNPLTGASIVRMQLLRDFDVADGIITIDLDLTPDHKFAAHISEEIHEKLDHLWDIKEVKINFVGESES
ncbi:MAG: iron-sulfur cluster assembly scaffold protein [candidate division WOR-3 bacterium]|nr:iron-sulfur cluster assembly scaffold protein [candidate division WOR-3 bacterium]